MNMDLLLDEARQAFLLLPGVVSVDLSENLLRIVVDSVETEAAIPKTFKSETLNYEIGSEIKIQQADT